MLSTVTGPLDALGAAGVIWPLLMGCEPQPQFTVELVGVDRQPLTFPGGFTLLPHRDLSDAKKADVIYIPSILILPDGSSPEIPDEAVEWLRERHRKGALLCSACTGTFVLARTGLLDGLPATTHWAFAQHLQRAYPKIKVQKEAVLVHNQVERIVTGGANASWQDLIYHLIETMSSSVVAEEVRSLFLIDRHEASQGAYSRCILKTTSADREVARAQEWLQSHMSVSPPVERVVELTGLPARTLKRRFKKHVGMTIIDYVKMLRVDSAKERLQGSSESVEDISCAVGYQDTSYFRRIFQSATGMPPSRYRERFRRTERGAASSDERRAQPRPE